MTKKKAAEEWGSFFKTGSWFEKIRIESFIAGAEWQEKEGEGLRWRDISSLPPEGVEVFFDGGENPPVFGRIKYNGKHASIIVIDSSGEEDCLSIKDYERWLDESQAPIIEDNRLREALDNLTHIQTLMPTDAKAEKEELWAALKSITDIAYNIFVTLNSIKQDNNLMVNNKTEK